MARNIGSVATFEKSIADWINRADKGFEIVVANTVTKTANAIVDLFPVDTGRFKANWQITANSPAQQSVIDYDKTRDQTKRALARQARAVARANGTKVIYITNRLDYSIHLEYGGSGQAPTGILGLLQAGLVRYFQEAVEEAKRAL
ncbi:hypothetical protein [Escherichia phage vB_EcoS_SCS31]|uniref:Neck protein n=1 Tax=Escherichia phage vB_EcoS_SCS31 TaxID=2932865 RepID=A0A9E6ZZF9_9CAUD|nr:hypothetical protein [Escherichia phage vB_EcoS_SCS31]